MILQSLVSLYETLADKGEISREGWAPVRVQYALEISDDGELKAVMPLEAVNEKGKPIARFFELPAPAKRTVGIEPNFLWDNSAYILGVDGKGNPERAARCFEAAKLLHLKLLGGSGDPFASAVRAFFERWRPELAESNEIVAAHRDELCAGGNLTFMFNLRLPNDNTDLQKIWQAHYDGGAQGEDGEAKLRCLVTGERAVPALTHPSIKQVRGAQSSGAALVSFNAPAFCSYGRSQNLNAPMSRYAAFAYTTALNALLADSAHVKLVGDATVVYWAGGAEPQYQDAFSRFVDGDTVSDTDLNHAMRKLASGQPAQWSGQPLEPSNQFYILGLSPNAARLSVRFFLRDSFGDFAAHINKHYERLEIERPSFDGEVNIPLWRLLRETVNPSAREKTPSPQMAADTLRAILTGARYPATLYGQTMLRVRAQREVTRGKAAIIKAYILRNSSNERLKEAAKVALNEQSEYTPYVLGRLFALLEYIQDSASGASTVKDRYFNSACATPAAIFPLLLKLKDSHSRVLMREKPGLAVNLEKQAGALINILGDHFPAHQTLDEQGAFILGYYHQTQKRYEKKENTEETSNV